MSQKGEASTLFREIKSSGREKEGQESMIAVQFENKNTDQQNKRTKKKGEKEEKRGR